MVIMIATSSLTRITIEETQGQMKEQQLAVRRNKHQIHQQCTEQPGNRILLAGRREGWRRRGTSTVREVDRNVLLTQP